MFGIAETVLQGAAYQNKRAKKPNTRFGFFHFSASDLSAEASSSIAA
jgi:hypothetical protein